MKRRLLIGMSTVLLLASVVFGLFIFDKAQTNRQLQESRLQVYALVQVGDPLAEKEDVLRENGFALAYEAAVWPTLAENYQQQLVVLGDSKPSRLDTFCYVLGVSNPFATTSRYVVIDADLAGTIIRID